MTPHSILFYVPQTSTSLLDVGCNNGALLLHANSALTIEKLYGVEINQHAVQMAKENTAHLPQCKVVNTSADSIPFDDHSIESATCNQVMEHIPEHLRKNMIKEVHRVLTDDSLFVITVPHKGLFAILDPANFRLMFPKLFGWFANIVGGEGREKGFIGQKHGIVWHHHFTRKEIEKLLDGHFSIEFTRWRGCILMPLAGWLLFPFYRLNFTNNFVFKLIRTIQEWEASLQLGKFLAYDILVVAKKINNSKVHLLVAVS